MALPLSPRGRAAYIVLDPLSDCGLDDYDRKPVYILYWLTSLAPFVLAGFYCITSVTTI